MDPSTTSVSIGIAVVGVTNVGVTLPPASVVVRLPVGETSGLVDTPDIVFALEVG